MKALKALIFILFFCNGLSTSTARECQTNAETIVLTSYPIKPKDRTDRVEEVQARKDFPSNAASNDR